MKPLFFGILPIIFSISLPAAAQTSIEEILVTARKQEERSLVVPVTLSTLDSRTIELFALSSTRDIAEIIPNLITTQRGSGAGAAIYLRGIGSDNNDAAFDSAVALNFDGVTVNSSRLITNGNLDVSQIEVLKGPQSLYFGKGASAGVISMQSANPTDKFEANIGLGREFEEDGWIGQALISGPLSKSFLARLAVKTNRADEVTRNTDPGAARPWRGEQQDDSRLTLVWQPGSTFQANFKYSHSRYRNDGNLLFADIQCRDTSAQPTLYGFQQIVLPNNYDCNLGDQQIQVADQNLIERQLQEGNNEGVPYGDQQLDITRLQLDWDLGPNTSLTSISALIDMDESGFDCFAYDSWGSSCITNINAETSLSQEIRLISRLSDQLNINTGIYYQDRELLHRSVQNTFGLPYFLGTVDPLMTGQGTDAALDHYNYQIAPPYPVYDPGSGTGFSNGWTKENPTDQRTISVYASLSWDINSQWNLTAGGRYTNEVKDNLYTTPYVHSAFTALSAPPFNVPSAPSGFSVTNQFSDDNFSPEASLVYAPTERSTYYLAYKTGFKSGGISSSQLPAFTTYVNLVNGDNSELIYDSETSVGFELGLKKMVLSDRLRLNASMYRYIFEDLQIQNFDPVALAFFTLNASEVTNQGAELDASFVTAIPGLKLTSFIAYTDTAYTEDFYNIIGVNLNGQQRQQAPEWTGSLGLDYQLGLGGGLESGLRLLANYTDEYLTNNSDTGGPNSFTQPSFWRGDLAIYLGNPADHWEFQVAVKNIGNEIFTSETVGRPNAIPNSKGESDLVHFQNRGRLLKVSGTYHF